METSAVSERRWTAVVAPLVMIVFGVVLAFTPLASVSSLGSVGNAGTAGKPVDCEEPGGGNLGNAGAALPLPDECEEPTPTPTPGPTPTAPPATTAVPDSTVAVETTVDAVPTSSAAPPPPSEQVAPQQPAAPRRNLPETGGGERSAVLMVVGLAFAVGGVALLLAGRRPARR